MVFAYYYIVALEGPPRGASPIAVGGGATSQGGGGRCLERTNGYISIYIYIYIYIFIHMYIHIMQGGPSGLTSAAPPNRCAPMNCLYQTLANVILRVRAHITVWIVRAQGGTGPGRDSRRRKTCVAGLLARGNFLQTTESAPKRAPGKT